MAEALLSLDKICKQFGRVEALRDVSLSVRPGRVHAVLGENGAGKSTLMRIAYGMMPPDSGTISRNGVPRVLRSPRDAIALGIGMVHQHFMLLPTMTVAENIALGMPRGMANPHVRAVLERREDALADGLHPQGRVEWLSVGAQQRVEIIKALARDATLLILDEPTAVLAPADAGALLTWLRQFATEGKGAILVTHKLREALSVADDITVLRRGRVVLQAAVTNVTAEQVVNAMLDTAALRDAIAPPTARSERTVVLRARSVQVMDSRGRVAVREATFDVRGGEIVGIAAVEGSGQRELLRAAAGRMPIAGGTLEIPTKIGFVPEDRRRDALIASFTLVENMALHEAGARRGWMDWQSVFRLTRDLLIGHDVRATGPLVSADSLSGGNQQKFVFAREVSDAPTLFVAENPARGLDLQATHAIAQRLRRARAAGMAVLLHSADLDELLGLSDRMLVVYAGVVTEVTPDYDTVGRAMLGAV
jgi:simple sugar transport system ATP-binding protein